MKFALQADGFFRVVEGLVREARSLPTLRRDEVPSLEPSHAQVIGHFYTHLPVKHVGELGSFDIGVRPNFVGR